MRDFAWFEPEQLLREAGMSLGPREEALLLAVHERKPIDPEDAALVAEYDDLGARGYVELKKMDNHMRRDRPLYKVVAVLTAEGHEAVREILRRRA